MDGAKMTASELADLIGMCGDGGYNQDAATMLRQQQAEIEALKQIIDANNLSQNIGQFVKAANEPVAYIDPYDLERLPHYDCHIGSQQLKNGIPLYTHPVKELTDEEIWDFINALCLDMGDYWELTERNAIPMIRAILRKVQE